MKAALSMLMLSATLSAPSYAKPETAQTASSSDGIVFRDRAQPNHFYRLHALDDRLVLSEVGGGSAAVSQLNYRTVDGTGCRFFLRNRQLYVERLRFGWLHPYLHGGLQLKDSKGATKMVTLPQVCPVR